jgi:hypothetical protein
MRSLTDKPRYLDRESLRALSPQERIELAFKLGDEEIAEFCEAQGVDRETAIRLLQRHRQAGRIPSKCMSDLIG